MGQMRFGLAGTAVTDEMAKIGGTGVMNRMNKTIKTAAETDYRHLVLVTSRAQSYDDISRPGTACALPQP